MAKRIKNGTNGKRRKNHSGTIELHNGKWRVRYVIFIDGERKVKTQTVTMDMVREAYQANGKDATNLAEPISKELAREVLAHISNGNGIITREALLSKVECELKGIRAEKEAIEQKARVEASDRAKRKEDERAINLADAWPLFVASKKRPDSGPRTLEGYKTQYTIFVQWLKTNHPDKPKMRDVTAEVAEEFIKHLESTKSKNTRNKYLVFLRMFWRVMRWHKDAQLAIDPWDGIQNLVQNDEEDHKELTVDELRRVAVEISKPETEKATDFILYEKGENGKIKTDKEGRPISKTVHLQNELAMLFAIGIYTGLRLGDCACLEWGYVFLKEGKIDTEPNKTKRKYKRRVILPIHPRLRALLETIPQASRQGYVLPFLADIYRNRQPSIITKRVQSIFRTAKLTTNIEGANGTKTRTKIGFLSLRHTFASIMLNAGVPYAFVEKMLGHSNQSMTAHYFHENLAALVAAIAKLPDIAGTNAPLLTGGITEAPEIAPDEPGTTIDIECTEGSDGRFSAFCRIWDEMTEDERKMAREYINEEAKE